MLKNVLLVFLFLSFSNLFAQVGLKEVFIEEFYTLNKADLQNGNLTGVTSKGLVCYRIYVLLDSGYTLQAVYGLGEHPAFIKSTSDFYNHPGIGTTFPNRIPDKSLKKNLTYLDSWLSMGACSETFFAVPLRYQEKPLSVAIEWDKNYFNNLKGRDSQFSFRDTPGMHHLDSLPVPTMYNIDEQLKSLMAETNNSEFIMTDGAWASLGKGAKAPANLHNAILIAQITTAGKLSYQLNLQIGTPNGKSIRYVASNPSPEEFTHPSLINKR
ncbi:MAG: hypothetical protein RIR94_855 [Bacteroidota bacterium]|jgi:hypothetical protein